MQSIWCQCHKNIFITEIVRISWSVYPWGRSFCPYGALNFWKDGKPLFFQKKSFFQENYDWNMFPRSTLHDNRQLNGWKTHSLSKITKILQNLGNRCACFWQVNNVRVRLGAYPFSETHSGTPLRSAQGLRTNVKSLMEDKRSSLFIRSFSGNFFLDWHREGGGRPSKCQVDPGRGVQSNPGDDVIKLFSSSVS